MADYTDEELQDNATEQTLEEAKKEREQVQKDLPEIVLFIRDRFEEASTSRSSVEERWLSAYRDFRGIYDTSVRFRDSEKSRVFVKIPKTKTLAAYGQIQEVLFSTEKFPLGVRPTEKPEGIAEKAHLAEEGAPEPDPAMELNVGYMGDERDADNPVVGGMFAKYRQAASKLLPGTSPNPETPTINPAKAAAAKMEKTIHDQLTESHAVRQLRASVFEQVLYGTGIIKGPYNYEKVMHSWKQETVEGSLTKVYDPKSLMVPRIEAVSVWNFYPDPAAETVEECEYVIERHKMNRTQLRDLMRHPFFNKEAIRRCIRSGPNYQKEGWEDNLTDNDSQEYETETRWEVMEYWGVMDTDMALQAGLELGTDVTELDELQINVWICGEEILRVVLNPFEPERIPYKAFPYEKNPHEFWGIGVPENMKDSTQIMNGHVRMAIDNLALSGNVVFDVDESAMVPGQPFEVFPGKIFRRQAGAQGQSVYALKFPNTTIENLQMFDKFRQLADEQTGIPSYSHGATGIQSTTRTASGMSMLMGAAALNIKTVIKNIDDFLLKPLGEDFYFWNMQFNDDVEVKGDLSVKALGTESVMQKEVKSQRLTQFLQIAANPALAPFVKLHKIIKEIAISLELDPEEIINDVDEAKIYASIIGQAGGLGPQGPQGAPGPSAGPTGNGDGTIGTGEPQMPGMDAFSGNTGGMPPEGQQ